MQCLPKAGIPATEPKHESYLMRDLFVEGLTIQQYLESTPQGVEQMESEWLFFPEIRTLSNRTSKPEKIREEQERLIQKGLEDPATEPQVLGQRLPVPETIKQHSIEVILHADHVDAQWREPLVLDFPYLTWEKEKLLLAYVPVLGIEIPIRDPEKIDEKLRDHIEFALSREEARNSLFELGLRQRCRDLKMGRFIWNAYPKTPKEIYIRDEEAGNKKPDVLKEVASRIDWGKNQPAHLYTEPLAQLVRLLSGKRGSGSVLIVGESGVGKTHLVNHLATRKDNHKLGRHPFFQTSGSRIVAGMCGFGQWQERCRAMAAEARERDAIIFFGNLFELMEVGQYSGSSESIASFFRPFLIRKDFLAIVECTPDQLALIEQQEPRLLEAFRQMKLDAPNAEDAGEILTRSVGSEFTQPALRRILKLHQRYAGYSAFPGRMLRFAKRLITENSISRKRRSFSPADEEGIKESAVVKAFATETGLPDFLLDDEIPMDVNQSGEWFRDRLIGQDEAVTLVIDTVAAIKARLTRPGKPLASFLFIGPTGVGKTELAKTLASYFYGSSDRMLRIDMSEYSTPGSAARLAAGKKGEQEGLLTARMRDQPFSVLLLDEFEKAHDSVYDLFLQILGEARLTDGAGRLADFSNSIIILTSNLGAAEFRGSSPGFRDPDEEDLALNAAIHFTEAVKKQVRPEFFNRIDRIVPFLPLDENAVRQIISRELEKAGTRDGFRTLDLSLNVSDEAATHLAGLGYDPRYGARPLKRAIDKKLMQPLAEFLTSRTDLQQGTIEVTGFDAAGKPEFSHNPFSANIDKSVKRTAEQEGQKIPELRRRYQRLEASSLVNELASEISRLRNRLAHAKANRRMSAEDAKDLKRLSSAEELMNQLQLESSAIQQAEERWMLDQFSSSFKIESAPGRQEIPTEKDFTASLLGIYQRVQNTPEQVVFVLTSDSNKRLIELANIYAEVASQKDWKVEYAWYPRDPRDKMRHPEDPDKWKPNIPQDSNELTQILNGQLPKNFVALAMQFKGECGLYLANEGGLHLFVDEDGNKQRVNIRCFAEPTENPEDEKDRFTIQQGYLDDQTLLSRDFDQVPLRRQWDFGKEKIKDQLLLKSDDARYNSEGIEVELNASNVAKLLDREVVKRIMRILP